MAYKTIEEAIADGHLPAVAQTLGLYGDHAILVRDVSELQYSEALFAMGMAIAGPQTVQSNGNHYFREWTGLLANHTIEVDGVRLPVFRSTHFVFYLREARSELETRCDVTPILVGALYISRRGRTHYLLVNITTEDVVMISDAGTIIRVLLTEMRNDWYFTRMTTMTYIWRSREKLAMDSQAEKFIKYFKK